MKRVLAALTVALLLITAGCMGGEGATVTTTPMETTTAATPTTATTVAPEETTQTTANEPTTAPREAQAFQTGNQSASMYEAIDGDTFELYYGDHDARGVVELVDVNAPAMNLSDIDPADFHYHDAATDAEMQTHQKELRIIGYEAARRANEKLSHPGGDYITVVHTGETTAEGVPLVYIYFDWNGRWTLYQEYLAGEGLGVLTNPDSPHASSIENAQAWAKDNDEGLWASNDEDDHPHD
ncbi:thermonuclease family protein [Haladaptatus sp. NG-SE-30]